MTRSSRRARTRCGRRSDRATSPRAGPVRARAANGPRFTDLEGAHAATVAKLNKGDKVRLEWDPRDKSGKNGGESK